mmetsp:Transcript_39944/g.127743  ORF Transcript_39944/g.127743 Transcript_39944/m.127743 type:complete len:229 (+) Transcript_39944:444-1130(+)
MPLKVSTIESTAKEIMNNLLIFVNPTTSPPAFCSDVLMTNSSAVGCGRGGMYSSIGDHTPSSRARCLIRSARYVYPRSVAYWSAARPIVSWAVQLAGACVDASSSRTKFVALFHTATWSGLAPPSGALTNSTLYLRSSIRAIAMCSYLIAQCRIRPGTLMPRSSKASNTFSRNPTHPFLQACSATAVAVSAHLDFQSDTCAGVCPGGGPQARAASTAAASRTNGRDIR